MQPLLPDLQDAWQEPDTWSGRARPGARAGDGREVRDVEVVACEEVGKLDLTKLFVKSGMGRVVGRVDNLDNLDNLDNPDN